MKVHNKLESINLIKKMELNSFPERLFKQKDVDNIKKFLEEYPAKYYAIRSKEFVGCKNNKFKVPKDKVLDEIKNFKLFTINVSSYNYTSNFILIGDIRIGSNNEV